MTIIDNPPQTGGSGGEQGGDQPKLTMGIDPYERNWMRLSIALLVVFFATVTIGGFLMGFQVTGVDKEVDPSTLTQSEPWSNPGLRQIGPNEYEAYVVSQAWTFQPRELKVPVGSKVTIYVSSVDLQHGFKISDTNVNMQIVPGQVSKLVYTFDTIGDFPYICTEFCGKGHATMYGTVKVVAASDAAGTTATTAGASATTNGSSTTAG